jgi:hypothetical protein
VLAWCLLQGSSRVLPVCLCCADYVLLVFPCLKMVRMCVCARFVCALHLCIVALFHRHFAYLALLRSAACGL